MKVKCFMWREGQPAEQLDREREGKSIREVMLNAFFPFNCPNWQTVIGQNRVEKVVNGKVVAYYRAEVAQP